MKTKKTPLRMCIICHEMKPKAELNRIVRQKDGNYTLQEKAAGRGAYVCKNDACMATCLKRKGLNRAFKEEVSEEVYRALIEEYQKNGQPKD